jgi:hypothetical protein
MTRRGDVRGAALIHRAMRAIACREERAQDMVKQIFLPLVLVACLLIVAAWVFEIGPSVTMVVAPEAVQHQEGHSYRVDVPPAVLAALLPVTASSTSDPAASTAMLYEDGVPIGRPHRTWYAVATLGEGRLSHWGSAAAQAVYFSSSDGSDPRSNGRAYRVVFIALPPTWLAVAAGLVLLVAGALGVARSGLLVVAAIALVVTLTFVWIWVFAGSVLISPDSATYITFHPWVPVGYPLFVAGVASAFGHGAIPAAQLLLLGAAALYVAGAVGRFTGNEFACAASAVAVVAYAPILRFAGYILSEALYATLLLVCAGAGLLLLKTFSRSASVTFALAAVLAWSVRPAGVFLALVVAYLACLLLRSVPARTVITWLLAPAVACFGLMTSIEHALRKPGAVSQTGRILFAQVGLRFEPEMASPERRADAELVAAAIAPDRAELDALTGWQERHAFWVDNYAQRMTHVDEALCRDPSRDASADAALLKQLALDTVAARPGAYLRWVIEDAAWSWRTNVLTSLSRPTVVELGWYADLPDERVTLIRRFALPLTVDEVTLHEGRPLAPPFRAVDLSRRMLDAVLGASALVWAFGAFLLVAVVAAPFSSSLTLRGLGLLGAIVHGAVTLVSATTASIDRYAIPTDPVLLVAAIIALHGVQQRLALRWTTGSPH